MKKGFSILILLIIPIVCFSQINFGIKGGMAFGYDGNLKNLVTDIKESHAKNNIGWHMGAYSRIHFLNWFLQPEIYFSSMKTDFNSFSQGDFTAHSNRLDIPVLVGHNFLGIGRIYAGPVFSTSLNEGISLKGIKKTKTDDFSLAGQVGTGLDISSFTFDVRYEFGFNDNETKFINKHSGQQFQLEKKQNSLILSIGYKF